MYHSSKELRTCYCQAASVSPPASSPSSYPSYSSSVSLVPHPQWISQLEQHPWILERSTSLAPSSHPSPPLHLDSSVAPVHAPSSSCALQWPTSAPHSLVSSWVVPGWHPLAPTPSDYSSVDLHHVVRHVHRVLHGEISLHVSLWKCSSSPSPNLQISMIVGSCDPDTGAASDEGDHCSDCSDWPSSRPSSSSHHQRLPANRFC